MASKWGAIFDFDGVIVDTEWHHEVCWQQVAKERNQSLTHEQYVSGFGVKNERFISEMLAWTQDAEEIKKIAKRKEEIFQQNALHEAPNLVIGVDALLDELNHHQIPCAIASSSILKNIDIVLGSNPVRKFFSQIVSGDDVQLGKPNPECFLKAAAKLHMPPERCVVFEDALLGVEAAKRAGCKVIAITTTFNQEEFAKMNFCPDKIIESFSEVQVAELESWFQ